MVFTLKFKISDLLYDILTAPESGFNGAGK